MSITAGWNISGLNPSQVSGIGTTAKFFPAPSGNIPQTPAVIPNPLNLSGQPTTPNNNSTAVGNYPLSAAGQLIVPGVNKLNGVPFVVSACGDFQVGPGGACPNVTIDLVANATPFAPSKFPTAGSINQSPSWQVLATTGALTFQSNDLVSYPWLIEAHLFGATLSGILSGWSIVSVDNTAPTGPTALTNTLSGLNFGNSYGVFGLGVRITYSVSEPGNSANLYTFSLNG